MMRFKAVVTMAKAAVKGGGNNGQIQSKSRQAMAKSSANAVN